MADRIGCRREILRPHQFAQQLSPGFTAWWKFSCKKGLSTKKRRTMRSLGRSIVATSILLSCSRRYGADPRTVDFDTVLWSRHPQIMRWFVANGLDLECDCYPIARAFRYKHREFLGVYMSVRDTVPTARRQATMALRYHAADGNLKWVSLLLWAGADPGCRCRG